MVAFKDKYASIGRVKPIIHDKVTIPATASSRSLGSLISPENKLIKIEILDNGYLILDLSSVIGNKAKINKTNAKKLAEWILNAYSERADKKAPRNTKSR